MSLKLRSFLIALACLLLTATGFTHFVLELKERQGVVFQDPLFQVWGPYPLHLLIFIITYLPIVFGILALLRLPGRREALMYSYSLLQIFRLLSITLIPLSAPPDMIVLKDPIADELVFGTLVTHDLFFSGHVSALVLFGLNWPNVRGRNLYFLLAAVDAVLLTGQHVHYSIDVLAAPFFAYLAFSIQKFLSRRLSLKTAR